jgi:hypothetical protein
MEIEDRTKNSSNNETDDNESEAELDDNGTDVTVMGLYKVEDSDYDDDVSCDVSSIRLKEQAGKINVANVEQTET